MGKKEERENDGVPEGCFVWEYSTEEHRVYRIETKRVFFRAFPVSDSTEVVTRKMLEEFAQDSGTYNGTILKGLSITETDEVCSDESVGFDRAMELGGLK